MAEVQARSKSDRRSLLIVTVFRDRADVRGQVGFDGQYNRQNFAKEPGSAEQLSADESFEPRWTVIAKQWCQISNTDSGETI